MTLSFDLSAYHYNLPKERIARYPLSSRDSARLLVWKKGIISHHHFGELPRLLQPSATLVFNTTRVIPARLFFRKGTGALIEIFFLGPSDPSTPLEEALQRQGNVRWLCKVRNLRRWKGMLVQHHHRWQLTAHLEKRVDHGVIVRFEWVPPEKSFAEILDVFGRIPLPPYLHRLDEAVDRHRYQTVFARWPGSVAAPTASLHFSESLLAELRNRFVVVELTLHVGAGTFQPIRSHDPYSHAMHSEQIRISRLAIRQLAQAQHITAVGTTAVRTLESLYWYARHFMALLRSSDPMPPLVIGRFPYADRRQGGPSFREAMHMLVEKMDREGISAIEGHTRLFIIPPYDFRAVDSLITNFHLPRSTLLLLVDAFVRGNWRPIYETALQMGYRFLSYGDASLLIP